jgi:CHAT domain-containing protein
MRQSLLAISQPDTPGEIPLPNTTKELAQIRLHAQNMQVQYLEGSAATPKKVVERMATHGWVHLACHAIQDLLQPTRSAFCLHNGTLGLFQIIEQPSQSAEFAFLSACQTAAGDEEIPDEAVHLAAAMLLAGYRSVIATMWSINDKDGPVIAGEVYSHLLKDKVPDSSQAAYALRRAVKYFREEHLRGGVSDNDFFAWVPFIHIGI